MSRTVHDPARRGTSLMVQIWAFNDLLGSTAGAATSRNVKARCERLQFPLPVPLLPLPPEPEPVPPSPQSPVQVKSGAFEAFAPIEPCVLILPAVLGRLLCPEHAASAIVAATGSPN
jgi:hypothetical protein